MAIQASAFPRLSPSGRRVVAGEKTIVLDMAIELGSGTSAQFGDDSQVYFTRQPDGAFMEWHEGAVPSVINGGFNAFSVGGRNRWAGYSAARGVVEFDNGTIVSGWSGPALSDDPSVWGAVIHERGEIVTSHGRPQRFADRDCRDLRWCGRSLVWNVYVLGRWQVAGCREPGAIVDLLNIEPEEFWPVPLLVNGELWLMTHSHSRLLLRPWGLSRGYVVAAGITNTPDAKQLPDGHVRVVWDAGQNVLGEYVFDPVVNAPIDLTKPTPMGDVEWTGTEPIDTLPLFVGEPANWPRTGSHDLHQVWDGRNFWLVKFASSQNWERWVLDGNAWYLREDRSQSGAGDYSFHDGLWCPRHAQLGVWNERPNNVLQRYEPGTCNVIDQHALPYRTSLLKAWSRIGCGGDIGVVTGSPAAVLIAYDAGSQQDTWEHYLFVRGWGLVRWTVQDQRDPLVSHTTTFSERGGQALTPTHGCWRRDLVPWPPSTPKPPDPKPEPPTPIPVPKPEPVMSEVSLQTFNRSNWIVAEDGGGKEGESTHGRPTGLARADRSNAGPWETFSFKRGADGRAGFRAPNGGWLSAQPDGTLVFNRHRPDDFTPDGWEGFRVEGALDGGVSFVTDHGTRVRAVNTGGSELRHDVREVAGIDETFFPSVSLTTGTPVGGGHPVGGGAGVPGRLGVAGRWFASPDGLFDYREVSAFALYSLWLQKRFGEVDAFMSSMAPYANALRGLLTLDGDFWNGRGYHCGPDMPGFYDELRPFLAHCESRGFYVRLCLVGAVEPFGGVWFPDRRDIWTEDLDARVRAYIEQVMPRISDAPNVLTEGANEPGQIGLRSSFDRVKGWGRLAKRLAPHLLHNFAAVDGPNDGDTSFVEAPADFVDAHIHRMKEYHSGDGWNGWLWVKRSSEHAVLDNERMPAMSGETINFGSSGVGGGGDAERSPAIAMAYGATSRLRRYIANFHFDDGLWCLPPNAETIACLEGWKRGLDAIPMDFGGGWCNGHHGCSPWETSNFPSSDEVRDHRGPVRIFGRSGGAGYIGASIREVAGHRPTARRPVEEITRLEWGGYACAVYRA